MPPHTHPLLYKRKIRREDVEEGLGGERDESRRVDAGFLRPLCRRQKKPYSNIVSAVRSDEIAPHAN